MVYIHLDLPTTFRPKAAFALKTMLSAFFMPVRFVDASEIKPDNAVTIYYGLHPEKSSNTAGISFKVAEKTIDYFDELREYNTADIFQMNSESGPVPVLFGTDKIDDGVIQYDIIASAFFLLSDWQSVVPGPRDAHGRAMYKHSVQAHQDAAHRPLVNEYADMLAELIQNKTGKRPERKTWGGRKFAGVITHDFDRIKKRYPGTWMREFVEIPFLNAHNLDWASRWKRFTLSLQDLMAADDGYESSIRKIVSFENELGIRPTVLLKSIIRKHKNDARDYLDYPFLDEIIRLVDEAEGELGFHSSYMAGYDDQLFESEFSWLKKRLGRSITSHRFHYVRFDLERGLGIPEKFGLKTDSSLGWAEQSGYRTGFTFPHKIYDIRNNRVRSLVEVPMMLMDMQVFQYMHLDVDGGIEIARRQVDTALRYGGVVAWNFHHHTYDKAETGDCDILFEKSLNYLHSKEPEFLTMGELYETVNNN